MRVSRYMRNKEHNLKYTYIDLCFCQTCFNHCFVNFLFVNDTSAHHSFATKLDEYLSLDI